MIVRNLLTISVVDKFGKTFHLPSNLPRVRAGKAMPKEKKPTRQARLSPMRMVRAGATYRLMSTTKIAGDPVIIPVSEVVKLRPP